MPHELGGVRPSIANNPPATRQATCRSIASMCELHWSLLHNLPFHPSLSKRNTPTTLDNLCKQLAVSRNIGGKILARQSILSQLGFERQPGFELRALAGTLNSLEVELRYLALCLAPLVLGSLPASAQNLETLDTAIKQRLDKSKMPGLTVAVVRPSGIITERGYGVRSAETREPVVSGMLFRPGSATKTWTAAALLTSDGAAQAVGFGSRSARSFKGLSRILPGSLCTSSCPIKAGCGFWHAGGSHDEAALAQSVLRPGSYATFGEPGKVFSYSNPGFQLAGYVLGN